MRGSNKQANKYNIMRSKHGQFLMLNHYHRQNSNMASTIPHPPVYMSYNYKVKCVGDL